MYDYEVTATETSVQELSFYINGSWQKGRPDALHPVMNPSTGQVIAQVPYANASEVDMSRGRRTRVLEMARMPGSRPRTGAVSLQADVGALCG